jgi:Holliday junction resolvasome RuvABC DNA-binding subunit
METDLKSKVQEAIVIYKVNGVNYKLIIKKDYIASLYPVK